MAGITVLFSAILSSTVLAQSEPETETEAGRRLEEVLVTAQKREESLQDVPISISVLDSEELSILSIFDFTETAQLTPGVDFFPGVQAAAIRLRGVGPAFFALTSPQSVAVFVDDFAQSSVGTVFATLVDIERLELLRGPQGTLYGQNAPGGAYNISTRAPNIETREGYIEASYGQQDSSDLESIDVRGAINVPLVQDLLGWRMAGVYADSDGYVTVENPASGEDSTAGKEHIALRSRMLWQIDSDMDLSWNVSYQDLMDQPVDFNVEGIVPSTGGSNSTAAIRNKFEDRKYYGDFLSRAETDLVDTSIHWRWAAPSVNVDFLSSYQDLKTYQLENRAPYPGRDSQFEIQLDWELFSAELRFGDTGEKMDYLAGIYYAIRDITGLFNVTLTGVNLFGPASGEGDVKAVYTSLTFHLDPKWDLITGARYDRNDIWTKSNFEFLAFNSIVDDEADFDHLSWSIKLLHYFNNDMTGYLALDNAYKQGGFNNLVPGLLALAPLFPEIAEAGEQMLGFEEETSTAIELGLKGSAFDGRMNYTAAIFYQEFEDHQLTQPADVPALITPLGDLNALFANQLTNAEEVRTQGIEIDVVYLLGQHWDLGLRATYFDAIVEEWNFRFCSPGEAESTDQLFCPIGNGKPLNDLPQVNSNIQIGHNRPLSNGWGFYGRLNWTWRSSPNITNVTKNFADPKNILGLTLGLHSVSTGIDVKLWGKNLTGEDLNINPNFRDDGDPSLPAPNGGRYHPGRSYGLTLSYDF